MKKQVALKALCCCLVITAPYIDILFILSLDILKKDIAYVHISFALYLVVVASHPMLSITGTLFDPYLITHQEMECFEIV